MTWWAVGATAVTTALNLGGQAMGRTAASRQARAEERRAKKEADLREKDLFAEYEASVEQQRDALAKAELAKQGEAEALRQAQLASATVDIDLSSQALSGQERAARRRTYFEDA